MNVTTLVGITIVFILTINTQFAMSQNFFVHYQDFESSYNSRKDWEYLDKKYDLLFILLLDSSHKQEICHFDPEIEELFRDYSVGFTVSGLSQKFNVKISGIEELFLNKNTLYNILNCITDNFIHKIDVKILFPVYVKDNTAIAEVSTHNTLDVYSFKLNEGAVQVNWLGGTIH